MLTFKVSDGILANASFVGAKTVKGPPTPSTCTRPNTALAAAASVEREGLEKERKVPVPTFLGSGN